MKVVALSFVSIFAAPLLAQAPRVVVDGLQGPHKILLTPSGSLLISETSKEPNSGRLSLVSSAGARRSLFEGLPSGEDVAGDGSGPSALALDRNTLYLLIGEGDTERRNQQGVAMHNPNGVVSPIFSSLLKIELSGPVDLLSGTFRLTREHQQELADGETVLIEDGAGGRASVSVLADFPNAIPDAKVPYRFSNPWGLALSADGRMAYVTDASFDSLVSVETASGRQRTLVHFPRSPNPGSMDGPMLDAVPTSVRADGSRLVVSFLTGFPFPPGQASVAAINPDKQTTETVLGGLTSVVDVMPRPGVGNQPRYLVLEFSQNQSAEPPAPGRLLRYDGTTPNVVWDKLTAPVSMALDERTGSLFVLELGGRVLEFPAAALKPSVR